MKALLLTLIVMLSGCSLFDTSAGRAVYTLSPVIVKKSNGDEIAVCCEISIYNSKDISSVFAEGVYDPATGMIKFQLGQDGVDSSTPIKAAVENQKVIMGQLGTILKILTPVL